MDNEKILDQEMQDSMEAFNESQIRKEVDEIDGVTHTSETNVNLNIELKAQQDYEAELKNNIESLQNELDYTDKEYQNRKIEYEDIEKEYKQAIKANRTAKIVSLVLGVICVIVLIARLISWFA